VKTIEKIPAQLFSLRVNMKSSLGLVPLTFAFAPFSGKVVHVEDVKAGKDFLNLRELLYTPLPSR
jgi:hypothetical protein